MRHCYLKSTMSISRRHNFLNKQVDKRTGYLKVHTDPPVRLAFRAIYVQIPQPDLAHAFNDRVGLLVFCDPDFFAVVALHGIECVFEV